MIWIKSHEQKRTLRNVDPQTVLTDFPDILAPKGSYIIYMNGSKALWRTALFNRARELGQDYPASWPFTYPLFFIMREEANMKGAELF